MCWEGRGGGAITTPHNNQHHHTDLSKQERQVQYPTLTDDGGTGTTINIESATARGCTEDGCPAQTQIRWRWKCWCHRCLSTVVSTDTDRNVVGHTEQRTSRTHNVPQLHRRRLLCQTVPRTVRCADGRHRRYGIGGGTTRRRSGGVVENQCIIGGDRSGGSQRERGDRKSVV